MDNALLIGNGLNQCLDDGLPWGNLLEKIGNEFGISINKDIPFPLEFERLINIHLQKDPNDTINIYNRVKNKVAEDISKVKLSNNAIHRELKSTSINSIITTNYDILLEQVFDSTFTPYVNKGVAGNQTKYLTNSVGSIDGLEFYHAHGCVSAPQTICLGYEHYMGMVEKIRPEINGKKKGTTTRAISKVLLQEVAPQNTWEEHFYTNNIGIIGLGMDTCELDLWWLLTHRASMYYANIDGMRDYIRNNIVYYDVIDDILRSDSKKQEEINRKNMDKIERHALLSSMHVLVHTYKLSETNTGTHREAYSTIIDNISKKGIV